MLTRLKVSGFKNLVDVDVRFGPFTCVAGPNAVGKSNLFDAIRFLSALADRPLVEAASCVRGAGGRDGDLTQLFFRSGDQAGELISFEAEMLIPLRGQDDLGQTGAASITFVRYSVVLARSPGNLARPDGGLELIREELSPISKGEARGHLLFPHRRVWRETAVSGAGRRGGPFLSTQGEGPERRVWRHQEGSGGSLAFRAQDLPRTVLSTANAVDAPTAFLARREMQSWRTFQLEVSALRQADGPGAPARLGPDGSHLPTVLQRLARSAGKTGPEGHPYLQDEDQAYASVVTRVLGVMPDLRELRVERDARHGLLSLVAVQRDGTRHHAQALSDGTLRLLALASLALDAHPERVICLEEPENGIHPERVPAVLRLLRETVTDPGWAVDGENPLTQVIVNTHSPLVVSQVPDDALLVAEPQESFWEGRRVNGVRFACLPDTWRASAPGRPSIVARGKLVSYLNPDPRLQTDPDESRFWGRLIDREDMQPLLPTGPGDE